MPKRSFDQGPAQDAAVNEPPPLLRRKTSRGDGNVSGNSQSTVNLSTQVPHSAPTDRSVGFAPLPTDQSAAPFPRPSTTRLASVSAILNQVDDDGTATLRRHKTTSPALAANSLPPIALGLPASVGPSATPGATRHILAPLSPSAYRMVGTSQHGTPASSMVSQPNLTANTSQARNSTIDSKAYQFSHPPSAPNDRASEHDVRYTAAESGTSRRRSGARNTVQIPSECSSPSTSHSSYSHSYETSPAMPYGASFSGDQDPRIPLSSSGGQNGYHMMSLELTSGTVQLPVDVQGASRVADEKRRRNAGASARFRQRRKEKEREASSAISVLEHKVKELSDGVGFYRRERDYLANVVLHMPGGERHFPRPRSPPRRRSSDGQKRQIDSDYGDANDRGQRSPDSGRNVRRRTSTVSLPPLPPHTAMSIQEVGLQHQYATIPTPQASSAMQLTGLPPPIARNTMQAPQGLPPMQSQQALLPGPPQLMQAPPHTGPWNPFAPERRHTGPPGHGPAGR